jgi:hypothetical protein
VLTVDGEQTKTTSVIKKTLNPYWNESFDVYDTQPRLANHQNGKGVQYHCSTNIRSKEIQEKGSRLSWRHQCPCWRLHRPSTRR